MGDLNSFLRSIDDFDAEIPKQVTKLQRVLALEVFNGVTLRSPVRTGRFRAAWGAELNAAFNDLPEAGLKNYPAPDGVNVMAAMTSLAFGDSVYISNALPYGPRLEDGHSGQAPAGMVAVTLEGLEGLIDA